MFLMPLALKTQNDSFTFVHELKQEMHADLKYVESLENEIDKLESDKAEFLNMYDILLQECVSNDVMCSYLHSLSDLDCNTEYALLIFIKSKNVNVLHKRLSKQTGIRSKENSPKHVSFQSPRESVGSNVMVHNHYLEEAKKKAKLQKDKSLNTNLVRPTSARLSNTANGNKPKPRNFNQQPRNWPPSMSSHLACPTCKKYIYSANHDECILKYLSKVNSRASAQKKDAQSHKKTKRYIHVEKKSDSNNHDRHIPTGQMFSPNKSSNVYLKTTPPRSGLTWKPTGRIFIQVGLKWIPIRNSFETRYNTNDIALPLGKETHNPKTVICGNSFSLSAVVESSSRNIDNSNMHTFYQPHNSEYRWTKDHPLEQVHRNPSKPVQTRRQLATDPEMCMFLLTVSTTKLKNIKEAMADSAWIEAMQDELHQLDKLQI
ncbi:hypothetical protein Tco_0496331 [Tanacetum coccineum]